MCTLNFDAAVVLESLVHGLSHQAQFSDVFLIDEHNKIYFLSRWVKWKDMGGIKMDGLM